MSSQFHDTIRPYPTPRVVDALRQLAFARKESDEGVSLTQAKNIIASEYGFESWQHLKSLSAKAIVTTAKTSAESKHEFDIKIVPEIHLDEADYEDDEVDGGDDAGTYAGNRVSLTSLTGRLDFNPPTEAVWFHMRLQLESKSEKAQHDIGFMSGFLYFENDENSLIFAFDAESGELESFAADFLDRFDEKERQGIENLAYISDIWVNEKYHEQEFSVLMIEALKLLPSCPIQAITIYP